ncbi:MAG: M23 family metallopeptidase [Tenuifilaceae bacterium]|nr:M23 family metallopeptidase [Tenuifilaceae bacterium]
MITPLKGRISSKFGQRKHPISGKVSFHNGIDIAAKIGTPIVSPANGTVQRIWDHHSGGKSLSIITPGGLRFGFAHLIKRLVRQGDAVEAGQIIAQVGTTGASTGPHLHFTVSKQGQFIDPLKYFTF